MDNSFSDIDECILDTDKCHQNASCMNNQGGYTCACSDRFEGNGYNCTLILMNECHNGMHKCDENAECTDTSLAYACTCKIGTLNNHFINCVSTLLLY